MYNPKFKIKPLVKGVQNSLTTETGENLIEVKIVGDWYIVGMQSRYDDDVATLGAAWLETEIGAAHLHSSTTAIGLDFGLMRTNNPLYWTGRLPIRGVNLLRGSITKAAAGHAYVLTALLQEMWG